jgi:hypothetical protein
MHAESVTFEATDYNAGVLETPTRLRGADAP